MSTRTKLGRGGRTRHAGTRQANAQTPPTAPSAFWPLACGAAAAALVFLVAAGYWSPSASVNGASLRAADGAVALAAAFLLAGALRSLHAGRFAAAEAIMVIVTSTPALLAPVAGRPTSAELVTTSP